MLPHEEEYRRIKQLSKASKNNDVLREDALREVARFVISGLRRFGASDGALCAWASFPGFEAFDAESEAICAQKRYKALHDSMWALARYAGVAHETSGSGFGAGGCLKLWWRISSEPLRKALDSEVWRCTSEFRHAYEAARQKESDRMREVKMQEWKASLPPPTQVGPATIADILGFKKQPNKAPEPTPGPVTPRATERVSE
jgi:hypothetical protein